MKGLLTWRELHERGIWDRYCALTGADAWRGTPAEGADPEREIILEQEQLLALGLITEQIAEAYPEKLPASIHRYGCFCDSCCSGTSVSLDNATATQMEAMLAGKIRNSTRLEFIATVYRNVTIKIQSSQVLWIGNGTHTMDGEEGEHYLLSWDLTTNSNCQRHRS